MRELAEIEENIYQKFQNQMSQVLDENEELKQTKLENDQLTQIIASLRSDNIELKNQLDGLRHEKQSLTGQLQKTQNQAENNFHETVSTLNSTISELNEENRKLAKTLAEVTSKSIELEKKLKTQSASLGNSEEVQRLNQKLAETTKDYNDLVDAYNVLQESRPKSNNADIATLKEQNQSLRATIRAQNEALLASDDSVKLSNKLKTENENLRLQLSQMKNLGRGDSERVSKLENQITLMNNALQAKDRQIQQLSQENRQLAQARPQASGGYSTDKQASLRISELEQEIEKSKQVTIEYRKKIKEYQDELMAIQSGNNGISSAKADSLEEQIRLLKLQNQELNARIKLLSGNANRMSDERSDIDAPALMQQNESPYTSLGAPSVQELLDQGIEQADVQYIRENYEHLKPMASANENNGLNAEQYGAEEEMLDGLEPAAGETEDNDKDKDQKKQPRKTSNKPIKDQNIVPEIENQKDHKPYDENFFNS